ncbi:MAG: PAS domain S-box protein, partial [Gemmatimonadaceae bacterium]
MSAPDETAWRPERFAQHLLQSAGEGIVVYDRELRYRVWNHFIEEKSGYPFEDLKGKRAPDVFPVMVERGIVALLERALAGETVTGPDLSFQTPSGETVWYVATYQPYLDEAGNIIGVLGHLHDVTARRAGEEKLRQSEARFRAIIEGASDLVIILDKRGIARYVSPAIHAMLGLTHDEFVGRNPIDLVHQDDKARVLNAFLAALNDSGSTHRVQYRARYIDGSWRTLLTISRNLLADPEVDGIVTSTRDITEWQELQERLNQSQKIEAIGRLAGGVAHDYNNLLTVITGNARMLLAEQEIAGEGRDELEEIAQAAERAATLTRQLLAFSRQQVLQPRLLNLNHVVEEMWKLLERLSGEGVVSERRLAEPLGAVMADPVQVEQVLINLVVNARDAMPDGGAITIETS